VDDLKLRDWLAQGLKKPGKSIPGVAYAIGYHRSAVDKLLAGKRNFHVQELEKIAAYLEEPVPLQSSATDSARLRELEEENARLKALLADYLIKEALAKQDSRE
jgi:hypothetical protein